MPRRKILMVAATALVATFATPLIASAAPESPATPSSTGAASISEQATTLQDEIDKLTQEMMAAADAANQAVGQASVAKEAAATAKTELEAATVAAAEAKKKANEVAADLYKQGPMSLSQSTLLSAEGPQDFIDKAIMTGQVTDYQVENINKMIETQQAMEAASKAADDAAAAAETKATEAQQVSSDTQAKLAAAQQQMDGLRAQAVAAGLTLPEASSPAPDGAALDTSGLTGQVTGQWALPASGTFTSGYGPRWGTFHYGIDIAAPIGTPIFAAGDGVVMRAGPASGFGLAVYIAHPNGDVTVYGHIDKYYVQTGQTVVAGQRIADMGNRGYSTGPHLHFEVQQGAYGTRVNPQTWLAERGISVG